MKKISNSQKRLLKSLAYFLGFESIEEIKVSELIRKAEVSRSTFYRLFETKEDFFQWVLNYHMEGLSGAAKHTADTPLEFYQHYFTYIYDHAFYFKSFNNSSMWPKFHYEMNQIGLDVYQKFLYSKTLDQRYSRIISHYVINAHIGVAMAWISETSPQSPKEIAQLVTTMTENALASQSITLSDMFPYKNV
ncbi:TetR-like C-terminal domain-containing protein [Enterococcus faecium]|uniref:TetR/AcrR family transcriptional regulator n=1 Tax=Enterococcus faecium TaxID=1352 RepID=UPI003D6B169C